MDKRNIKYALTWMLLFLLHCTSARTQNLNFKAIDKKVKSIRSVNVDTLAKKLIAGYKTDTEKVRSIFKWITEHIAYDVDLYHDTTGMYKKLWQESIESGNFYIQKDYNDRIIRKVLTEKKGVCGGYARLFKALCDRANIRCEMISGYIRWRSDPIGMVTDRKHAWNAVYINNSWKLIDATWASGYSDYAVSKFTKFFDDFFFFCNPVEFFNDHYPLEAKWSLLPNTPSRHDFYNFPFYYPDFYRSKITYVYPTIGIIDINKRNRSVRIELDIKVPVKDFFVIATPADTLETQHNSSTDTLAYEGDLTPEKADYIIQNKRLIYAHTFKTDNPKQLDVILNGKLILSYGVRFR